MNDPRIWNLFFNAIKPMFAVTQYLGLLTFSYSKNGLIESHLNSLFNILLLLIYSPINIHVIFIRFSYRKQVLYKTTDIIQLVVFLVYLVVAWIMSMIQQKKHIKLINELKMYDKNFSKLGKTIRYEKTWKYTIINIVLRIIIISISIIGQYITFYYDYSTLNKIIFLIANCFPIIINSAVCLQTITYIKLLQHRFQLLNNEIKGIVTKNNKQRIKTIEISEIAKKFSDDLLLMYNVCALHHHLTKLIKRFNKTFGVTLLVMFGVSFVNIVVGLYFPCVNFRSEKIDWPTVINYLLLSLPFIVDTIYICQGCNSTIDEVKKSGILIHKIDTDDYDMKDEIEMFSLQIANEEVEFTAAGFFPINFTLLFSIIGGVTTYIIILIQLSNP